MPWDFISRRLAILNVKEELRERGAILSRIRPTTDQLGRSATPRLRLILWAIGFSSARRILPHPSRYFEGANVPSWRGERERGADECHTEPHAIRVLRRQIAG
jgi:hypothetical protein